MVSSSDRERNWRVGGVDFAAQNHRNLRAQITQPRAADLHLRQPVHDEQQLHRDVRFRGVRGSKLVQDFDHHDRREEEGEQEGRKKKW